MRAQYDAIILGSGIGGLTAALLLAKLRKQKVLVLERHTVPGGFTHTFRRGKFEWDTGLHYVGHMRDHDFPRKLMNLLTDNEVAWRRMPEVFEVFSFPKFQFRQRAGEANLRADLIRQFPEQKTAIEKYFRDLTRAQIWGILRFAGQILPAPLAWLPRALKNFWRRYGRMTLLEYFNANIRDENLRAVLAGPCGDYGLPPSRASFFAHSLIVRHYVNGAHYPEGGSGRLPKMIGAHLKRLGADLLTNAEAEEILITSGRVTGVRARVRGEEKVFHARHVISAIGARQTYGRLLKNQNEVVNFPKGLGLASIYLGLKESPAKLGFGGENHWLFSSTDFETMEGCYISFPSLKDPNARQHTAEIMLPASLEEFSQLSRGGWRRRGPRYDEAKKQMTERVLNFIEERHPGFKALIEYVEVATPLSVRHFTAHEEVYGLPATPARYRLRGLGPRTKIRGLYLAGADVLAHGIVGAMMGGFSAYTASGSFMDVVRAFREIIKSPAQRPVTLSAE